MISGSPRMTTCPSIHSLAASGAPFSPSIENLVPLGFVFCVSPLRRLSMAPSESLAGIDPAGMLPSPLLNLRSVVHDRLLYVLGRVVHASIRWEMETDPLSDGMEASDGRSPPSRCQPSRGAAWPIPFV